MISPSSGHSRQARGAVFLSKDGTLIDNQRPDVDPMQIRLRAGAVDALAPLHAAGFQIAVVSHESGIAFGALPESELREVQDRIRALLNDAGIPLAGFFYCPHHPGGSVPRYARPCSCRKPAPGLLYTAAQLLGIDLQASWMVGDTLDDVEAGARAGCHTIFLNNGGETEWFLGRYRTPEYIVATLTEGRDAVLRAPPVMEHRG